MTVQNFKSGVVERFRGMYILKTVTAEGVPKSDKEFPNSKCINVSFMREKYVA
jgi:hypothetical protein